MGEPIKKLGQIVSDIQDTLGQFNDHFSNKSEIDIPQNNTIEKEEHNRIKEEKNIYIINNNNNSNNNNNNNYNNTLNIHHDDQNYNEVTERDDNVSYSSKSNIVSENIYEKVDDISTMSLIEKERIDHRSRIESDDNSSKYQEKNNNNENEEEENDQTQSSTSRSSSEKYSHYKNQDFNNTEYDIKPTMTRNDVNSSPRETNSNLNNNIPERNINRRHTKEYSHSMKLNIPDENTYLLMKDLIEKTKQKTDDINHLNSIINEYDIKNKTIEEENRNLRKINKAMQFKLDEINANLLNMASFDDHVDQLKEGDEAFSNKFSSINRESFITQLNELMESFSTQLNNNTNHGNSYLTKITIDKLINDFYKCLSTIKMNIKEFSEEKPYSLCRSVIDGVCQCFKDCHKNIDEFYTNSEDLDQIKIDVNDIDTLKEEYKKALNSINKLELENKRNVVIIEQLNSQIDDTKAKLLNYENDDRSQHLMTMKYKDMTDRYNKLLVENENMKKNQGYLETLIDKWKQENNKLQKAILSFKSEYPVDKDLLQKNRILKNQLDDERLNIKKYNELIKALKTEIDQLKAENIHDNSKLTKQVNTELSSIKDIQSVYLESIKQITDKYNENEVCNSSNNVKIFNRQVEKLYEAFRESDKIKEHLALLERTIEDQNKEKEKVVIENKKMIRELNELQDKFKTHEEIWLKKCKDLNNDLNSTKNLLSKTHNDYVKKEKEVCEYQAIIDDYLLQYSKACDTCIAISSINKKSTQFLDDLCLKPGLSKQPFPFDEEIKHLCTWIKENESNIIKLDSNTKELNAMLNDKNQEITTLKTKSEELTSNLTNLQVLYDESKRKEKEYEEKLDKSIQKQNLLKKKIDQLFKGCQLFISGAPASAYSLNYN